MIPMMIASSALQAVSAIQGGQQDAAMGRRNGQILDEQARITRSTGYEREGMLRQRNARTLSDQRAALIQNGIDPSSGTAAIGVGQNTMDAEMDALTLRYESLMQARGLDIEASNARYAGRAARTQSYFSAAGSLMQAGASYAGGGFFGAGSSSGLASAASGYSSAMGRN